LQKPPAADDNARTLNADGDLNAKIIDLRLAKAVNEPGAQSAMETPAMSALDEADLAPDRAI
jgi:hypothetical protein